MARLVINPIGDVDDIRREAATNTKLPGAATQETNAVQPASPETEVAEQPAVPISEQTVQTFVADSALVSALPTQAPVADQVAAEAPAVVAPRSFNVESVYPNPTHEAKAAEKLEGQASYTYNYKLPASIYIIASFSLLIALFIWVAILFLNAHNWLFFLNAFLFTGCGAGLLLANKIAWWASIVSAGIGTLYYGYRLIDLMVEYSDKLKYISYYVGVLDSYIKAGFFLFAVGVLYLLVSTYYLSRSDVRRAFR